MNDKPTYDIDLLHVKNSFLSGMEILLKKIISFIKRYFWILAALFVLGAGLGFIMDKYLKSYESKILVSPNFNTVDYVYNKVELIDSRIRDNDVPFLEKLGISKDDRVTEITIKPLADIYALAQRDDINYDVFKTMTDNADAKNVIEDFITSKNFERHIITVSSKKLIPKETLEKIMLNLNAGEYYQMMRKDIAANLEDKIVKNDSLIIQIDRILQGFNSPQGQGSVFLSEKAQLSELLNQKIDIIEENQQLKVHRHNLEYIVTPLDYSVNLLKKDGMRGKYKFTIPVVFLGLFLLFILVKRYW